MQGKLKATFPYLVCKICNFQHVRVGAWHLVNRLLNTVLSSSLDIADTAQQVLMAMYDTHCKYYHHAYGYTESPQSHSPV